MKSLIRILSIWIVCTCTYGQQLPTWSSLYENAFIWNPATTARYDKSELSLTHRNDWTGFKDAPVLSTLGFQFPFVGPISRVSIGAFGEMDRVGPYKKTGGALTYAYRFRPRLIGNKFDELRIGLSTQFHSYGFDPTKFIAIDGIEFRPDQLQQTNRFNINAGVYYASHDTEEFKDIYYLGISANKLLPGSVQTGLGIVQLQRHFTLHAGYRWYPWSARRSARPYFIEPNVFAIYAPSKPVNVMMNIRYEMIDKLWASIGFVSNAEAFLQAGVIIGEDSFLAKIVNGGSIRIGAKIDYAFGPLGKYGGIGYEAYIAYIFKWT